MLARKRSPLDRFDQALLTYDFALPDASDIDYIENKHPNLVNSELLMSLGNAISKRRWFIRYCRDQRSQQGIDETTNHDAAVTGSLSTDATLPSLSNSSNFNLNLETEGGDNISSTSAPTMADYIANLNLPRLVDLAPTRQTFECPICFTNQTFKHEKSWL